MRYIDGFVAAVPAESKGQYQKHASDSVPIFKEFGVKRQVEAWGHDVPKGEVTDYYRAVKAEPDEVIVFSWMEYDSREDRVAANDKMMKDERMANMGETMPFDGARMIYGGFEVVNVAGQGGDTGYVDGSLIPVPNASKEAFVASSRQVAPLLVEYGALRTVDAWGDDVPDGKITDFKRAVDARPDETVVFSFVEWTSKAARDAAWEKIAADPRMREIAQPFEGMRMVIGGFESILDA